MKQVLIAAPISEKFKKLLVEKNYEVINYPPSGLELPNLQPANLEPVTVHPATFNLQLLEGIITSNKLLLTKSELEKYPNLRWIARLGSGMEIIDTVYCDEKGIKYFSSPSGIANSVAEHVTGMLLSLLHKIHSACNEIKSGFWIREANRGIELESMTVGIIGYGNTGKALVQKLSVFTKSILVYDKFKTNFSNQHIKESSLEEIQSHADIISFHVPLNIDTKHYYNDDFFSKMKKNHILINTSRGAIADTNTILQGLQYGKISGACLDVLEEEKDIDELLTKDNNIVQKLLSYNVILTPHIAGYSHNAIDKMSDELLRQIDIIL